MAICPYCGADIEIGAKFCSNCGKKIPKKIDVSSGLSIGDKNVIAGDAIGQKIAGDNVQNKVLGNAVFNTYQDDTKIVNDCAVCGKHMTNDHGHTCPRCGEVVCEDCFDKEKKCCEKCKQQEMKRLALANTAYEDSRDGNTYKLVKIGNRIWFAENFRFRCGKGSFCHDKEETPDITRKYGYLYTWRAAVDFCPEGFHLPTRDEWLDMFGSMLEDSDTSLSFSKKFITTNGWNCKNTSGFNARPSGKVADGKMYGYHESAGFWSSFKDNGMALSFNLDGKKVSQKLDSLNSAFSVRYVKDSDHYDDLSNAAKIQTCSHCGKIINEKDILACPKCGAAVCSDCFIESEERCKSCKEREENEWRAKIEAEENARRNAELAKRKAEEKARIEAEKARRNAEEKARADAERAAKAAAEAKRIAEEKAKHDAELAKWQEKHGFFVDYRDKEAYNVIKIGDQVWLGENFRYDCEGSYVVDEEKYGRLYSKDQAELYAPEGWHLPTKAEYSALLAYAKVSGEKTSALMAKDAWPQNYGTDNLEFSAMPAGYEYSSNFKGIGEIACFWVHEKDLLFNISATGKAYFEDVYHVYASVRYIKDDPSFAKTLEDADADAERLADAYALQAVLAEMKQQRKKILNVVARVAMVILAMVLFFVNYTFFSQDFESTGDYILNGILAYIIVDIAALGSFFAAFRLPKRKEVLDDDYNASSLLGGGIVAGIILILDILCVDNPIGDFVFDALELAFACAWVYGFLFFRWI